MTRLLPGAWHPGHEGWAVSATGLVWLRPDGTPSGIYLTAQLIAEDSSWRRVLPCARR